MSRNSDLPCARGEWPVLIEPIKSAANGRFRESARQRGANDVAPASPAFASATDRAAPAQVRFVRRADIGSPSFGALEANGSFVRRADI